MEERFPINPDVTDGSTPGIRVADTDWPRVTAEVAAGAIGILPVGAASKAHGPHLPMNTDLLQAEWLAGALIRRVRALVWPTLGYGFYPAFTDYPGSISVGENTFADLAADILEGIRGAGVTRALVVNTGISTIAPLEAAIAHTAGFDALTLVNVYEGPRFRAAQKRLETQPRGGHADEIETSIMLAIAPSRVDMSRAEAWASRPVSGRFNRSDPEAPGYSPNGIYGDPTLATVDKGRQLLDAMLEDVVAALESED